MLKNKSTMEQKCTNIRKDGVKFGKYNDNRKYFQWSRLEIAYE